MQQHVLFLTAGIHVYGATVYLDARTGRLLTTLTQHWLVPTEYFTIYFTERRTRTCVWIVKQAGVVGPNS